jgi:hypothetical protein
MLESPSRRRSRANTCCDIAALIRVKYLTMTEVEMRERERGEPAFIVGGNIVLWIKQEVQ